MPERKKGKVSTDGDGNVIDPPVLPDYEAKLQAAHDAADTDEIARLTAEYQNEQKKVAQRNADRDANREVNA